MLEAYQKELDKKETPPGQKPEWEPTLKDVLANKEDSDLFGELLKREGEVELTGRLAKGELTEDDIAGLDERRKQFLSTIERAKTVKESISDDVINAYTRNNPELQQVVSLIGPEAYKNLVKEKIKSLSIKDPWTFDFLAGAVEDKNKFKEDYYSPLDKEITELCKQKNIKAEDYMKALATEDPLERSKALRESVRAGYGKFAKAADWLSAGEWSKKRVQLMESRKEEIDAMVEQMKVHQASVGHYLAGMVQNDEVRAMVSKQLIGENVEREQVQGFREAKGQMPTEEGFQTKWAEYKAQRGDWESLRSAGKDKAREEFLQQQKDAFLEANKKKAGFWGSIFSIFFESFLTNNKNNLN